MERKGERGNGKWRKPSSERKAELSRGGNPRAKQMVPEKERLDVRRESIPSIYLSALCSCPKEDETLLQRVVQIRELRFDLSNSGGAVGRRLGIGALSA